MPFPHLGGTKFVEENVQLHVFVWGGISRISTATRHPINQNNMQIHGETRIMSLLDSILNIPHLAEVVMKAVQTDGSALMFASEELQRDKDVLKRVGICTDNHSSPSSMFL